MYHGLKRLGVPKLQGATTLPVVYPGGYHDFPSGNLFRTATTLDRVAGRYVKRDGPQFLRQ
jgi:hypothetical protein